MTIEWPHPFVAMRSALKVGSDKKRSNRQSVLAGPMAFSIRAVDSANGKRI
jgi:hypothetical protein